MAARLVHGFCSFTVVIVTLIARPAATAIPPKSYGNGTHSRHRHTHYRRYGLVLAVAVVAISPFGNSFVIVTIVSVASARLRRPKLRHLTDPRPPTGYRTRKLNS